MVDFIAEVEEELRKDDYNSFLRRFGPVIIGVLVAVVAFVGYLEYRDYAADRTARAAGASYIAADDLYNDGKPEQASRAFLALADVAPDGYAGLSLMRAAIIAGDANNPNEAVRLYDAASERFELPRHKDLASLKAAYVVANQGNWGDVRQRAEPLAAVDAPYEFLARELMASAALNMGDRTTALREFGYLNSVPGVPGSVKQRAEYSLTTLRDVGEGASLPAPTDMTPETPEVTPTDETP